ncbi:ATP-binding cassette domain-containing protein [Desulfomicrobium escambiense]|uniref:ATP-binding cassette domain-containing protein n=1 Tax=Desulfomicrobium escambiense TaxID=29503 RepID=UPI00040CB12F|nr:ATP-binding cassette domain-containing protein [Desulfomicrobium escambiense]
MIVLTDIGKQYGRVRANDSISLTLEPGRIYALVGENGAGKSTLMRILAGHTVPDAGTITVRGRSHARLTPALAASLGVGMLYQDPLDFPALPVWENFRLGGTARTRDQVIDKLGELSNHLGVCFLPGEAISSLTVGERQLLELLRLLDLGATTLILDEPTTGITPEQKRSLFGLLTRLAREEDHTVVLVTHKLSEALEMADAIFVMRQGRLVSTLETPCGEDELVRLMFGEAVDRAGDVPPVSAPQTRRMVLDRAVFAGPKYHLGPLGVSAAPGEMIGLAGLDGSGQELFLRGLCGLDRLAEGALELDGRRFERNDFKALHKAGVHFVPADRMSQALFPDLSIREHILLAFPDQAARLEDFRREQCEGRFNLRAHPDTPAKSLSGGNQQRLLLSLIPDGAPLLLMEHPTRGLDAGSSLQVWEHLRERCRDGATIFFFSPDLDEVIEHSHRVLVFFDRMLVADVPRSAATVETLGALMAGKNLESWHAA